MIINAMFSWFRKTKYQTVSLPGEVGTLEIPEEFQTELEGDDNSTLLFFDPASEDEVIFRLSSLTIVPQDASEDIAYREVQKDGQHRKAKVIVEPNKAYYHYVELSKDDSRELLLHFWQIGSLNTIVILSATITKGTENSKAVRSMLESVPHMIDTLKITKVRRTLQNEDGNITVTTQTLEPVPERRRPLNSEEQEWLSTSLRAAEQLFRRYGSGGELKPRELDAIYSRWLHETGEKEPPELIADALGAAFGQFIVQSYEFSWVIVSDQYGTEYAVQHPVGNTTSFPRASVQKRIDDRAEDFFGPIHLMLLDTLKQAGSQDTNN